MTLDLPSRQEFKDMAGIGRQARPVQGADVRSCPPQRYDLRASFLRTTNDLLGSGSFSCRRRGLRGIAYSTVRRFVIKQGWHQPEVKT